MRFCLCCRSSDLIVYAAYSQRNIEIKVDRKLERKVERKVERRREKRVERKGGKLYTRKKARKGKVETN